MRDRHVQRKKEKSSEQSKGKRYEDGLPVSSKIQILGFFIFLLSLLVILSIVSYSSSDQSRYESFNLKEFFVKENPAHPYSTSNWLGIAGVLISGFFIRNTFGYFSIFIPILTLLYGIFLIRKKTVYGLIQPTIYSLMAMISLSAFAGVLRLSLGAGKISDSFTGNSGEYLSSILKTLLGTFGSYILLVIFFAASLFLLFNKNISRAAAKLKVMFESFRERYRNSVAEMKEKKETEAKRESNRNAMREEVERIKKSKSKNLADEDEEELIKETKINRPSENEMVKEGEGTVLIDDNKSEPINIEQKNDLKKTKHVSDAEHEDEPAEKPIEQNEDYPPETLDEYQLPALELLDEPLPEELELISDEELKENGRLLQAKLLNFGVKIEKVIATPGPVVTLYELVPAEDVKLSRIESLENDIALAMKAKGIRMIIPIPGKGTVGVEIPNHKSVMVKIRSVIGSKKFNDSSMQLPIAFGKTISGDVYVDDLAKMPHLLIAGSTGSGKSVGINVIITSLLYKLHPTDLKLILIDPKKIELNLYEKLKRHYLTSSKDYKEKIVTTPQNAVLVLKSLEIEMEKRYEKLANATVRNISDYNKKFADGKLKSEEKIKHGKLPYIVVIIDELADLMITAAREVEEPIARLAQLARAVGIHLVLATQRPSVDVITGVIKANFSARISYLVNSKIDSRTILDMNGAEALLGQGDMLYLPPGVGKPMRIQSPYISSEEVEKVTEFIKSQPGFNRPYELPSVNIKKKFGTSFSEERDEMFEEAARLIVRSQQGSVSFLQRRLKLGYSRAARIMDELELAGIVGQNNGSKTRDVLIESEAQLEQLLQ